MDLELTAIGILLGSNLVLGYFLNKSRGDNYELRKKNNRLIKEIKSINKENLNSKIELEKSLFRIRNLNNLWLIKTELEEEIKRLSLKEELLEKELNDIKSEKVNYTITFKKSDLK